MNKLQPIRAYARYTEDVKSVKRSAGDNFERDKSPHVYERENLNKISSNQIRQTRVLINAETELNKVNENNDSKNPNNGKDTPNNAVNYYGIKARKPGCIVNQLEQHRWKSTLHGRINPEPHNGIQNDSNLHKMIVEKSKFDQNQKKESKTNYYNDRSKSFQPSVIRRREGNKLKTIDIDAEMTKNIKMRRQQEELQKSKDESSDNIMIQKAAQSYNRGVKKIVLKENTKHK